MPPSGPHLRQRPPSRLRTSRRRRPIEAGKATYHRYCGTCHGDSAVSTGVLPDLRYTRLLGDATGFAKVVRDGVLADRGMFAFGPELSAADVEQIRAYVIRRAHETRGASAAAATSQSP